METINFQDFQFEVQRRVYYALQKTFPSLEIIDFNKVFECDERVAYMKFDFFQKYPEGQLPIQKLEQEKEENVEYILEKLLPIFRKKEGI